MLKRAKKHTVPHVRKKAFFHINTPTTFSTLNNRRMPALSSFSPPKPSHVENDASFGNDRSSRSRRPSHGFDGDDGDIGIQFFGSKGRGFENDTGSRDNRFNSRRDFRSRDRSRRNRDNGHDGFNECPRGDSFGGDDSRSSELLFGNDHPGNFRGDIRQNVSKPPRADHDNFKPRRDRIISGRDIHQQLIDNNEPIDKSLFPSRQESLFNREAKYHPQSHWKQMREKYGEKERGESAAFLSRHLPVPIIGEAIYGTHSVLSAIVNQKRKLNNLYILASVFDKVQSGARPANFLDDGKLSPKKRKLKKLAEEYQGEDEELFKNYTAEKGDNDDTVEDNELDDFDDSFLVDSSSLSPLSSQSDHLQDPNGEENDIYLASIKQTKPKYINPHHKESNHESLMMIYELAQSIPIKITALRRDKLDQLSGDKPHNGVVLDAEPLEPEQKASLTNVDFTVPILTQENAVLQFDNITAHKSKPHSPKQAKKQINSHIYNLNTDPNTLRRPAVYLALESIFDPNNLGAIIRSASFFGVDGLIIPKNSCPLTTAVSKVSSGALDSIKIIECDNLEKFIQNSLENSKFGTKDAENSGNASKFSYISGNGHKNPLNNRTFDNLCVIGLGLNPLKAKSYNLFDFVDHDINKAMLAKQQQKSQTDIVSQVDPFSVLIVAGNEGFGLSKNIENMCHLMFKIPNYHMTSPNIDKFNSITVPEMLDSLNVSNAVAVSLYEIIRSHNQIFDRINQIKQLDASTITHANANNTSEMM